uniref:Secretogranin III n=1 Tax=Haemonchus contortus TaxID=6289 RepID=A0A7I4Y5J6_HAECO
NFLYCLFHVASVMPTFAQTTQLTMQCLLLVLLPSIVVSRVGRNAARHRKGEPPLPDIHALSKEMFGQELKKLDPNALVEPKTPEARKTLDDVKDDEDLNMFVELVFSELDGVNAGEHSEKDAAKQVDKWLYSLSDDRRIKMENRFPSLKGKRSPDGKNKSPHDIGDEERKKLLDRLSEEMFGKKLKDVTTDVLHEKNNPVVTRTIKGVGEDSGALDFVYEMLKLIDDYNHGHYTTDNLVDGAKLFLKTTGSEKLLLKLFPTLEEIKDPSKKPKTKETKPPDTSQGKDKKIKTTQPNNDQKRKGDKEISGGGGESKEIESENANKGQEPRIKTTLPNNDKKTVKPKNTDNSPERNLLNRLSKEMFGEEMEDVNDETMKRPKNPTAASTVEEAKKDEGIDFFANEVVGTMDRTNEGKLTPNQALKMIRRVLKFSPSKEMLLEMYPTLKEIDPPKEDESHPDKHKIETMQPGKPDEKKVQSKELENSPDKELLDRLSKEMFGENVEDVNDETMKRPKNPTAQNTAEEAEKDEGIRDFADEVVSTMDSVNEGKLTPNQALEKIGHALKGSPSKELLLEKFPTLKEIDPPKEDESHSDKHKIETMQPGKPDEKKVQSKELENSPDKKVLDRLSEEMFGGKVEDVSDQTMDEPSNPTAQSTANEAEKDNNVRDFVFEVLNLMKKKKAGAITSKWALKGIGRSLTNSPSQGLLVKKYPTLKEIADVGEAKEPKNTADKEILDRLAEEIFGEKVEEIDDKTMSEPKNPTAESTVNEAEKNNDVRDFVFEVVDLMKKAGAGKLSPKWALKGIGRSLTKSPSRGFLAKKYPTLKEIADVSETEEPENTADKELLDRLAEEMFGEKVEKINDKTMSEPKNPTAESTVNEAEKNNDVRDFVFEVVDLMKKAGAGKLSPQWALKGIGRSLTNSPSKGLLVKKYPTLKKIADVSETEEPEDTADEELLDRLAEEMFGEKLKEINDKTMNDPKNPTAKSTANEAEKNNDVRDFVFEVVDLMEKAGAGKLSPKWALKGIGRSLKSSPSQGLLVKKYPTLKELGGVPETEESKNSADNDLLDSLAKEMFGKKSEEINDHQTMDKPNNPTAQSTANEAEKDNNVRDFVFEVIDLMKKKNAGTITPKSALEGIGRSLENSPSKDFLAEKYPTLNEITGVRGSEKSDTPDKQLLDRLAGEMFGVKPEEVTERTLKEPKNPTAKSTANEVEKNDDVRDFVNEVVDSMKKAGAGKLSPKWALKGIGRSLTNSPSRGLLVKKYPTLKEIADVPETEESQNSADNDLLDSLAKEMFGKKSEEVNDHQTMDKPNNPTAQSTANEAEKDNNVRYFVFEVIDLMKKKNAGTITPKSALEGIGRSLKNSPSQDLLLKKYPTLNEITGVRGSEKSEDTPDKQLLDRLAEEMFGEKPEEVTEHTLKEPKNPTAKSTANEVEKNDDVRDFVNEVVDSMKKAGAGKLSPKWALKGIGRSLTNSPSRGLLVKKYPTLKEIADVPETEESQNSADNDLLDSLAKEMFGKKSEEVNDHQTMDKPNNPTAQSTADEAEKDNNVRDFVFEVIDLMKKKNAGTITPKSAVEGIGRSLENSPSQDFLVKKYPTLNEITGVRGSEKSEDTPDKQLLDRLAEEMFGVKPEEVTERTLKEPKNPTAKSTANEVEKNDDVRDFVNEVVDSMKKAGAGKLSPKWALKGIGRSLTNSPSRGLLVKKYPTLKEIADVPETEESQNSADNDLLDSLTKEMFGKKSEEVNDHQTMDKPNNPTAQSTADEAEKDNNVRDFVFEVIDLMKKKNAGTITPKSALEGIGRSLKNSPSQDLLLKKYPTLNKITGVSETEESQNSADNDLLDSLAKEMFGEKLEEVNDQTMDEPKNPTAKGTANEAEKNDDVRDFVFEVLHLMKKKNAGKITSKSALEGIGRSLTNSPSRGLLVEKYPTLKKIADVRDTEEPPNIADKELLDRLSKEMFGKGMDEVDDHILNEPDNLIAQSTVKETEKDDHVHDFVFKVLGLTKKAGAGKLTPKWALKGIVRSLKNSPSKGLLVRKYPTLRKIADVRGTEEPRNTADKDLLDRLAGEMFGAKVKEINDHILDDPKNPTAKSTANEAEKNNDVRDFVFEVVHLMKKAGAGKLSPKWALKGIGLSLKSSPSQGLLVKKYPTLKELGGVPKTENPPNTADNDLLDRLAEEMFGKKLEEVNDQTMDEPNNPTAQDTANEAEKNDHIQDFVFEVLDFMKKKKAGTITSKWALKGIGRALTSSPSQGLLVEKYPSLKKIRCRLKKDRAAYKDLLNRLSKEMFGVKLERVNKCTVKRPKNPTAKSTAEEMNRDGGVRHFVLKVIDLMRKKGKRCPKFALRGIGRALTSSPSRDMLLEKYPTLREIIGQYGGYKKKPAQPPDDCETVGPKERPNPEKDKDNFKEGGRLNKGGIDIVITIRDGGSMDKTAEPPDDRETVKPKESPDSHKDEDCVGKGKWLTKEQTKELLDRLSKEMFGVKMEKVNNCTVKRPKNPTAKSTVEEMNRDPGVRDFVYKVIDLMKTYRKRHCKIKALRRINHSLRKSPSQGLLVKKYPSLKEIGCRLKKDRAAYKDLLNRLSKEMFGVKLEKVNKCTVKRPKNPTAKSTVKEMNRDGGVRDFVHKVIYLMKKERDRYPKLAVTGIGHALRSLPSRESLLRKYPTLREIIGPVDMA